MSAAENTNTPEAVPNSSDVKAAAERLVWGSDWPHPGASMFRYLLLASALIWASSALAQQSADFKFCAGNTGTVEERIAACDREIKSGKLGTADLAATYFNRGIEWHAKHDYEQAIADYTEAIRLNPKYASAFYNRGNSWRARRDNDRAIADYTEAIRLNPKYAAAYNNRGNGWHDKRDYDRAIADYTEAIRLNAGYASAYYNRGNSWSEKRDYERAIADYNEAIRLNPGHINAHGGLAWLLATSAAPGVRNARRAVELAQKAVELSNSKDADKLDTLAAALAAAGNFKEAVRRQEQALAFPEFERTHGKGASRRLELYRQGKPYIEAR